MVVGRLLREATCQSATSANEASSGAIDDVQAHEHADEHATAHALTSCLPKQLGLISSRGLPTPVVTVGRARERGRSNYPILGWALALIPCQGLFDSGGMSLIFHTNPGLR